MQVERDEQKKILEIWLTSADQRDAGCSARIAPLVAAWRRAGYLPVIYKSGAEDLYERTSALLILRRNADRRRFPPAGGMPGK